MQSSAFSDILEYSIVFAGSIALLTQSNITHTIIIDSIKQSTSIAKFKF